ncbi:hypothetical protein RRG08_063012, partial [Elysia crispata]
ANPDALASVLSKPVSRITPDKASPDSSVYVLTETVSRITPDKASPDFSVSGFLLKLVSRITADMASSDPYLCTLMNVFHASRQTRRVQISAFVFPLLVSRITVDMSSPDISVFTETVECESRQTKGESRFLSSLYLLKLFNVSRQTRRVQIPQSLYLLKLFHVSRQIRRVQIPRSLYLLKLFHVSQQTRRVQIPQSLYLLKLFHVSRQTRRVQILGVYVLTETVSTYHGDKANPDALASVISKPVSRVSRQTRRAPDSSVSCTY